MNRPLFLLESSFPARQDGAIWKEGLVNGGLFIDRI
jgi:hypothetical protein